LLKDNFYFVDEAYKIFPKDCKILILAFEIYIQGDEFEKAHARD